MEISNLTFSEEELTFSKEEIKRTFRSYVSMVERCCFPPPKHEKRYGKLNIYEPWLKSFETFLKDMGPRPEGTTLDRIDNDGDYFLENCRWATPKQQCRNRSNTHFVEYKGQMVSLAQLCEELSVDYEVVRSRLRRVGMDLETALTQPKRHAWRKIVVEGKEVSLAKPCRSLGLDYQLVRDRLRRGWSLEKATNTPKLRYRGRSSQRYAPKWRHYE